MSVDYLLPRQVIAAGVPGTFVNSKYGTNPSSAVQLYNPVYNVASTAQATGTVTAAAMLNGIFICDTTAGVTLTLPTLTLLEAELISRYGDSVRGATSTAVRVGVGFYFRVVAQGANTVTLSAGTNVTPLATVTVTAANKAVDYCCYKTGSSSWAVV